MLLNQIEIINFLILIAGPFLYFNLFGISLGRVQYRVVTKTRITSLFLIIISALLIITAVYSANSFMELQESLHGEVYRRLAVAFASYSLLCIWTMVLIIKSGEIREKGISTRNGIYKWKDIQNYRVSDGSTIEVFTNKKTLISKRNKIIEWDVEEKSVEKLKGVLNQYIKEYSNN